MGAFLRSCWQMFGLKLLRNVCLIVSQTKFLTQQLNPTRSSTKDWSFIETDQTEHPNKDDSSLELAAEEELLHSGKTHLLLAKSCRSGISKKLNIYWFTLEPLSGMARSIVNQQKAGGMNEWIWNRNIFMQKLQEFIILLWKIAQ